MFRSPLPVGTAESVSLGARTLRTRPGSSVRSVAQTSGLMVTSKTTRSALSEIASSRRSRRRLSAARSNSRVSSMGAVLFVRDLYARQINLGIGYCAPLHSAGAAGGGISRWQCGQTFASTLTVSAQFGHFRFVPSGPIINACGSATMKMAIPYSHHRKKFLPFDEAMAAGMSPISTTRTTNSMPFPRPGTFPRMLDSRA